MSIPNLLNPMSLEGFVQPSDETFADNPEEAEMCIVERYSNDTNHLHRLQGSLYLEEKGYSRRNHFKRSEEDSKPQSETKPTAVDRVES